ncbi:MAG TPA: hypothetical protein VEB21_19990, partial [Terriglobales bacterium]|nr:hypothetical protein [Terriglobales bacterium]
MLRTYLPLVTAAFLLIEVASVAAQSNCLGDVDGDLAITANDARAAADVLFDSETVDEELALRSDANDDGRITVADLTAILSMAGSTCPGFGTPTATRTATGSAVPTRTRTPTATTPPTATPTMVCVSGGSLPIGVSQGSLSGSDCTRSFRNEPRFADEVTVQATPGQAVRIQVTATAPSGPFVPYLRVLDANGYFGFVEGRSPIEFVATTNLPYRVIISSDPTTEQELGPYQATVSTRNCSSANLQGGQQGSFDGNECPAVFSPTRGIAAGSGTRVAAEPADVYTFNVTQPMTLVTITMSQVNEDSFLDPLLTILGPDGHEIFPSFQGDDAADSGFGFDAQARFLALQPGSYTVIATGAGCEAVDDEAGCRYTLIFRTATCAATALTNIPTMGRLSVDGVLHGDQAQTRCAGPPPLPGRTEFGEPEIGSPADIYTFQANVGDAVTIEVAPDGNTGDEPIVYLFGPAAAGFPL